jgi:single-strand DNA-binding protein
MLNKVILIGNLGQDVEVRFTPNGTMVGNFSMAVNEVWTDKEGKKHQKTDWVQVTVWKKLAENCKLYISKGSRVYVEGKLRTQNWVDKTGSKRYRTYVEAFSVKFLDPSKGNGAAPSKENEDRQEEMHEFDTSDLTF